MLTMTEFISQIDNITIIPAIIMAVFGVIFLSTATSRLRRGNLFNGGIRSLFATLFLGGSIVLLLLGTNLYTYQRLTLEHPVASVSFWEASPQKFLVVVNIPEYEPEQSYTLYGDEWQLDARILKWSSPAILAGLDSRFRLERLSGRYSDLQQEREAQRSVFELSTEPGLSVWQVLTKLNCCSNWIDTYYGNSTYLPMADQAQFDVIMTQSGIIARPGNEIAELAIRRWN
jgi:hypothetical protein